MPTIVVALKDIITDADQPIDLTTLPEPEAVQRIKDIYGFLSADVQVTIADGLATITVPDEKARQANLALRRLEEATRLARRGRINQAIPLYQEVLKLLPEHTQARRDLAMALMETGSHAAAKKQLIRVMQLQPEDAWAYLIMGNLYFHHERDLGSAERYYQSAHDLAPNDAYVLTALAGLKAHRGDYTAAQPLFEQAIAQDPSYPNPVYGLALLHARTGDLDAAIDLLEGLLAAPESDDPRRQPVYDQARQLYLDLQTQLAEQRHTEVLDRLREEMDRYSNTSGHAIKLQQDATLSTNAKVELAWVHGRPHHLIKYRDANRAALAHLIAHEFEHILLQTEARNAGRNRQFATTATTEQYARRLVDKDTRKLARAGLDARTQEEYLRQLIHGLANQLLNLPLDLIIDSRIHASLFVSMATQQAEARQALTEPDVRNFSPGLIYRSSIALNCAFALFADNLFNGLTNYAEPYRTTAHFAAGQQLYTQWQQAMATYQPGDEYDLVDTFAATLRLNGWYEWLPDVARPAATGRELDPIGPEGGSTNPDFLQLPEAQAAATMYMVGALERFAGMPQRQIMQIAGEIALLGSTGIDYTDSIQKYTLRFLPGEQFSGLQLLSLMYVGFKQVNPELDTGLPFAEAYTNALQLYQTNG
ncbi:MAG: hypothetical protein DCC55_21740 [Chloroflexi bacterium]|nr:MAG: hypothetical protein DCC55_21740 [Chloroflexota bacterium]